jgi:hypothetical protein
MKIARFIAAIAVSTTISGCTVPPSKGPVTDARTAIAIAKEACGYHSGQHLKWHAEFGNGIWGAAPDQNLRDKRCSPVGVQIDPRDGSVLFCINEVCPTYAK